MAGQESRIVVGSYVEALSRPRRPGGGPGPSEPAPGYSAAEAAHEFEEFLELRLSLEAFWAWLQGYPAPGPAGSPDPAVEDEIDRATLALLALQHGTRSWPEVERELMRARGHLTGLTRL
jgi:hypothetical protein